MFSLNDHPRLDRRGRCQSSPTPPVLSIRQPTPWDSKSIASGREDERHFSILKLLATRKTSSSPRCTSRIAASTRCASIRRSASAADAVGPTTTAFRLMSVSRVSSRSCALMTYPYEDRANTFINAPSLSRDLPRLTPVITIRFVGTEEGGRILSPPGIFLLRWEGHPVARLHQPHATAAS